MAKGDYSKTTWNNGVAPAINANNLQNIEDKIYELDNITSKTDSVVDTTTISGSGSYDLTINTGLLYNNFAEVWIQNKNDDEKWSQLKITDNSLGAYCVSSDNKMQVFLNLSPEIFSSAGADIYLYSAYLDSGTNNRDIVLTFKNSNVASKDLDIQLRYYTTQK